MDDALADVERVVGVVEVVAVVDDNGRLDGWFVFAIAFVFA